MDWPVVFVVIAAILAVVSVTAAIVATRAVGQIKQLRPQAQSPAKIEQIAQPDSVTLPANTVRPEPVYEVIEGRVIVAPTQAQVVAATMTRPTVRLAILVSGVAHALRPESRDRISALIRREYLGRKRARQQAARAAARAQNGQPLSQTTKPVIER